MIKRILNTLPLLLTIVLLLVLAVPVLAQPESNHGFEVIELRTESSKTFKVDADHYTTEFYAGIKHYKDNYNDPNEIWKDVDLFIKDGKMTTAPYSITIDYDKLSIDVTDRRTGAQTILSLLQLNDKIPSKVAPIIGIDRVTFRDVAPFTDVVILLGNNNVKFQWILRNPAAGRLANFTIEKEGIPVTSTAVDAQGNLLELITSKVGTALSERLADVLPPESYPITIDPTLTFDANASSGHLRIQAQATWDDAHDAASATVLYVNGILIYTQATFVGTYYLHRGFLYFDTSDLPDDAIIGSASLSLYGYSKDQHTDPLADLGIVEGVQSTPLVLTDYGTHVSKTTLGADSYYDYDAWSLVAYNVKALNATGISWIDVAGITRFCLRGRADITDTANSSDYDGCYLHGNAAAAEKVPVLSVDYTLPGLPEPPTDFTITKIGVDEVQLDWTTGVDAVTTYIRVKSDNYPTDIADGYLVYDGALETATLDGLELTYGTYCFSAWSENPTGYSLDTADAKIGGDMLLLILFGFLALGLTGGFFWKQAGVLGYGAAGMWALLGFAAFQSSTSTSPAVITDTYMALFWLCMMFVIGCMLLPTIMKPKPTSDDLYIDEIDRPLYESYQADKKDREYQDRIMPRRTRRARNPRKPSGSAFDKAGIIGRAKR